MRPHETTSAAWLAAAVLCAGSLLEAQRPATDTAVNDPSNCPYCAGDPERMAAAGIVSHGGFDFGRTNTAGADELLADVDIYWIETAHFVLGLALEPYKIAADEKAKIRDELTRLSASLPAVQPRERVLDPWLRVHLYAQRLQDLWARIQGILQVTDADFPDGTKPWFLGEPYFGEGPHLGQRSKYEILILPDQRVQDVWLADQFGLETKSTQIWNIPERGALTVVMNGMDERLRRDGALHGHVAFNVTQNLIDGYKYYAYRTPVWLREGLAHALERELDPRFNSFSYSEGSLADKTRRSDWWAAVRKLVQTDEAPRIAELVHLHTPAQFELKHHFVSWSMTVFLLEHYPDGYACLTARLHGIKNAEGINDGSRMKDRHRDAFRECVGLDYAAFDAAWAAWATDQRMAERPAPPQPPADRDRQTELDPSL